MSIFGSSSSGDLDGTKAYSWDAVTDEYEAYFADLVAGERTPR